MSCSNIVGSGKQKLVCVSIDSGCSQNVDPPFWTPPFGPLFEPPSGPLSGPLFFKLKKIIKNR